MPPDHEHQTIFEDVLDLVVDGLEDPREIGRGGSSVVYRVRQPAFGRDAALKVVDAFVLDDEAKRRYERECLALGSLAGHPNIVTLYDAALTTSWRPYLVLEFLAGGSMADRLEREGPLPWREAVDVGVRMADALGAAHDRGVLHRDLKPANLLVSDYGIVKLADFGIARVEGVEHTRTGGNVVASIAHAAPEVLGGEQPSQAADVWALASTICELLSGQPPFRGEHDESFLPMIERINDQPLPTYAELGLPARVQQVLALAMDKDPARRPASGGALRAALAEALDALVSAPPPPPVVSATTGRDGIVDPLQEFSVPMPGQRTTAWDELAPEPEADRTTAWGPQPEPPPVVAAPRWTRRRIQQAVGAVAGVAAVVALAVLGVGALRDDGGAVRPLTNAELERSLLADGDVPPDFGQAVDPASTLARTPIGPGLCPGDGEQADTPRARASRTWTGGPLTAYLEQQLRAFPDRDAAVDWLESVNAAGLRCAEFTRDEPTPATVEVTNAPAPAAPDDVGVVAFDVVVTDEASGTVRPARLVVVQVDEYTASIEMSVATPRSTPPDLAEVLRATERSLRALP